MGLKVSELKIGQGKVDINLEVKSKAPIRAFEKFGKQLKVASAEAIDSSGDKITLSLWNDDADKVNVGDFVSVTNGYVSEYNGQKQLSSGKFGKIEVVSKDASAAAEKTDKNIASLKKSVKKAAEEDIEDVEF